ncbi:MAG: MFS transporter, partial [Candidatus Omnitrophica bacterium]|nr:MFS transporter [Candidatus Omnitrophota bacterium]
GYGMLISVPLLSLAGYWQFAAVLIVMERLGKAIRSPAKDTIVSQATKQVGTGFGFGLQEAMDQIGAIAGPLIFTFFFLFTGGGIKALADYQKAYGLLWIPFLLVMVCVVVAYIKVPSPESLEAPRQTAKEPDRLTRVFWLYTLFTFVTTLGYVNFALLGFHFKARGIMSDAEIPFVYALAMGIDGAAALGFGKFYDILKNKHNSEKGGINILWTIPVLSAIAPLLVFVHSHTFAVLGVLVWGVVMGIHETIMKSVIADITPLKKRGTGYGIFNTSYGLAAFAGSVLMGVLYDISVVLVVGAAIIAQVLAFPIFSLMKKEI